MIHVQSNAAPQRRVLICQISPTVADLCEDVDWGPWVVGVEVGNVTASSVALAEEEEEDLEEELVGNLVEGMDSG